LTFLVHFYQTKLFQSHCDFSGIQMKTILKALFLLVALSAVPAFAQQGERRCEYRDGAIVGAMWSCPRGTIDITPITVAPLTGTSSTAERILSPLVDSMNHTAELRNEMLTSSINRLADSFLGAESLSRDEDDLENEMIRLETDTLASGSNTAVANQSAAEPADLASIIQALSDSSSDAVITDAELSAIADKASSISSDFGQAFVTTRSFISQSAAVDTDPAMFTNTQYQMRLVYGNLDLNQTLVMVDFALREAVNATRRSNDAGSDSSTANGQDLIAGLTSLNNLHERGLLNEEEFNTAKRRLLGLQ
jgi:hypothetical protein